VTANVTMSLTIEDLFISDLFGFKTTGTSTNVKALQKEVCMSTRKGSMPPILSEIFKKLLRRNIPRNELKNICSLITSEATSMMLCSQTIAVQNVAPYADCVSPI
jgi:hypothetical protein